ncbi:MAG: carbohydrate kinase family protein [Clostridia bacterium]|nr:carbohydrate kinase family protein [Clostridia bacterium]
MKKIVGLGACVYDTLISCDKYPEEDTKQMAESVFVSGGGPVGNALVVASKLGVKTEVIGAFANDDAGKYLIEDFKKYGVKTDSVKIVDGARSFTSYIVLSRETETRTCVFDEGNVPDEPDIVNLSAIRGAGVLHLDGNYIKSAICAAKFAKEYGVITSLDAGGLYNGIERLLPYIDILIPSAEFIKGFTKETDIKTAMKKILSLYSPEVLVVTNGADGGYYSDNGKILHYNGITVNAVDTNGAGDTFHGAFLAAYSGGKSIGKCCEFASKVAAFKCMNKGVRTLCFDSFNI